MMSCGPMWWLRTGMSTIRSSERDGMSTTATRPSNSHVNTAVRPSGVKSAWSIPAQSGVFRTVCTAQVWGS